LLLASLEREGLPKALAVPVAHSELPDSSVAPGAYAPWRHSDVFLLGRAFSKIAFFAEGSEIGFDSFATIGKGNYVVNVKLNTERYRGTTATLITSK
jgi:hypothetical protein